MVSASKHHLIIVEPHPSYLFEELLTRGTDEIVPTRLLQRKRDDRLQSIKFDEMVEKIAVIEPEQNSKETESSWCSNGVNTEEHHAHCCAEYV